MDIEKAIEKIQELLNLTNWYPKYSYKEAIITVLNELEKKDNLIHKLADTLRYYKKGEQEFCYDICDKAYVKCECKDEECIKNIIKKAEEK